MKIIERKHLVPFLIVTSLFLLWGLANNMTDTLLAAFKNIMTMSDTETSLIQFAFYGSYFCFALPAALYIRKKSYKSGIILGLLMYAIGAMLFFPAAMVESYVFYLIAIYIMAGGCSILETTANPYILSMGSPETATRRLNIAQSFNPVGSIMGIVISKHFILNNISLYSISGTYAILGLELIGIIIIMLFANMPLGKGSGEKMAIAQSFSRLFKNKDYTFGVIAQFFYVGAQICVWSYTIRIIMKEMAINESEASNFYLASIIGFCASRFVYTWLMKYIKPTRLLVFSGAMSTIATLMVIFGAGTGWTLAISLICISVFMSLMFPTIYGIALGKITNGKNPEDAKIGASGLIMAILGGAVLTPLQGIISDATSINTSYIVPAVCFVVVLLYALYSLRNKA